MIAPQRPSRCALCGLRAPFGVGWRHGSDPLGPYYSDRLTKVYCSEECEMKDLQKETA